jgi:pilus assembly protein CpaC
MQSGLVKILAEPNIMAISGQEGKFLAGGIVFLPVPQTLGTGGTVITLQQQQFGVGIKFTPTVLSGGKINLKVAPEVSEVNPVGISISANNSTQILPAINTRQASTTVQLYDGQSFAIGGLIKNNVVEVISAFPWLANIPVLGALFRSSSFQNDRSELLIVVTPRIVKPLDTNPALPTDKYIQPSQSEFFLEGRMEGRKPATTAPRSLEQQPVQPNNDPNPAELTAVVPIQSAPQVTQSSSQNSLPVPAQPIIVVPTQTKASGTPLSESPPIGVLQDEPLPEFEMPWREINPSSAVNPRSN